MSNSLGPFQFALWLGTPGWLKAELEINRRPGVRGVGLRDTGVRGEPFSIVSVVDLPDLATGTDEYVAYRELTLADPQDMSWNGINTEAAGVLFQVLDGFPIDGTPKNTGLIKGGINGGNTLLIFRWILQPIEV